MKLPLFVHSKNKFISGAIVFGLSYAFYYLTNHHPVMEIHRLPLTWIDLSIPLIPSTIFIYISEYFYFAFVFWLLKNRLNINHYLYAIFFLQIFSCLIFIFFPTAYPRENYPIPEHLPRFLEATWMWLRTVDSPNNCFPSLHVSSVYLSALAFWTDGQKKWFAFFFTWASLITLSTLTTKQHYLMDILSGMSLAYVFFKWFHYKQEYFKLDRKILGYR